MRILKLEPFSGLSGDMFLGLLADLADAHKELEQLPKWLNLEEELAIEFSSMNKVGIACTHVKIRDLQSEHRHQHGHHHHHHRHLADVNRIIDESTLDKAVKSRAKAIFLEIGKAESEVHGVGLDKIHFHEVGAIDSIADVVGAAWLIEKLQLKKTYCEVVCTGFGFVETEHGRLPVPAPATQKILLGMPTSKGEVKSEMVTPTGAAILKSLNPIFQMPSLVEEKVGYGPGEKEFKIPNVLRGALCNSFEDDKESLYLVQCNLDDECAEYLGNAFQNELLKQGALDVVLHQSLMKKGRPGVVLETLIQETKLDVICDFILERTTSIGLRYFPVKRKVLERRAFVIDSEWGKVAAKEVILPSGKKMAKPESNDVVRIAEENNLNPNFVKQEILKSYDK